MPITPFRHVDQVLQAMPSHVAASASEPCSAHAASNVRKAEHKLPA